MSSVPAESPFVASRIGHAELAAFAADCVNLRQDDVEEYREQVRRLRDKLDRYAANHHDYGLIKTLLSGSLAKGTALKTLNDIDLALYVKASKAPTSEPDLLNWLAERLREAYPQMDRGQIKPNLHSVTIKYAVSGLSVDVVPVLYDGAPDDRGYLFATDGSEPVLTSIPLHLAFTRRRKEAQKVHFAQVVRFLKWWVRVQRLQDADFKFKSFMAELIVAHLADRGVDFSDYSIGLERVFGYIVKSQLKVRIAFADYYASTKLPKPTGKAIEIFDPVNEKNNVAAMYENHHREKLVSAAQDALEVMAEARFATTQTQAVECWQQILGPSFRG